MDEQGRKRYRLKPMEQFAEERGVEEQPSKQYFKASKLPDIIKTYALPKKLTRQADIDKGKSVRLRLRLSNTDLLFSLRA